MIKPLALAIDIGSSAVRSAVVDAAGAIVASARAARIDSVSGDEFVPALLWRDVVETVLALPAETRRAVVAVGVAGHVGTVFVDAAGAAVGAGRGWSYAGGVELLVQAAGDQLPSLLQETGRPIAGGSAAAAFLALRRDEPAEADRVAHVLTPKDFVVARLTERLVTDRTSAAYSGLSTVADGVWSSRMLGLVGLSPAQLPEQFGSSEVIGELSPRIASELGLGQDVVVVAGATDGSVGAAFVLRDRRDLVADIAGTTDVILRLVAAPTDAPTGSVVNPYPLEGFSVGGPTGATGGALAYWSALFGFDDVADAVALAASRLGDIGPGAAGLLIDPSLSGSRFPYWRADRAGAVRGQRDDHRAEHFLLAAAEGAAHVVRDGIDRLDPAGLATVVLAGGAARSRVLAQLRANVLGRVIEVCEEPDVSLLGAALLAFRGRGVDVGLFGGKDRRRIVRPDPAAADAYEILHAVWRRELGFDE
jgi:sugar (pentulose or hexulose) kinase